MDKKAKIVLIGTGVALVAAAGYYFLVYKAAPKNPLLPGTATPPANNNSQSLLTTTQNALNTAQQLSPAVQQIAQQVIPSPPTYSAPAGAPNLQDGMGIRVTDGPFNGYVYLYSVGELGPIRQWVQGGGTGLQKYFGNSSLSSLLASGKIINVSSAVASQIPEAASLSGFGRHRRMHGLGNVALLR
jgi:hypothetical protein